MIIPGKGRLNKSINLYKARACRKVFDEKFSSYQVLLNQKNSVAVRLVSFSCAGTFPDQLLSILSFIKFVGIPEKWSIYSDGTYLTEQIERLNDFEFVEVVQLWDGPHENSFYRDMLTWQEKKFYAFASVHVAKTTIFLDSDVLFFRGFNHKIVNAIKQHNWYLPYFEPQFDDYFMHKERDYYNQMNYTNSGFFILNENIDWEPGKKYLKELKDNNIAIGHFSEQTAMEIVFKYNALQFLDARLFSLSLEDHFSFFSTVNYAEIAVRHFVGPVRFRMWLAAKEFNYFL